MQQAVRVASRSATLRPNTHVNATGSGGGIRGSHLAAGGIGGLVARAYLPALALAGGGYGLAALNNKNQQIVSAQLQTNAVVGQAAGNPQQGQQAFDWLRYQANRIGFNYLDAAPDYNRLLSGLTGAGMSVSQGQDVFKGFSEYSRVNKLDRVQQQRVYRALSQIAGKNKLQAEELTQQLAESMPGAVSIFAEAYQKQKGGNKTGQEAISELMAAMKKGQVKGNILTFAGDIASQRSQAGLTAAGKASQAEQARFQNAYTDLARVASDNGVESGFARLFRTLNAGLSESGPMVEKLARGFDDVTKYVSYAVLSFQSLQRFFEGKDSYLGDKLFPTEEAKTKAFEFLETFKSTVTELGTLTGNLYNKWVQLLGLMDSSETLKALTTSLRVVGNGANAINSLIEGDMSGAKSAAQSALAGYGNTITAPGRKGANLIIGGINSGLDAVGPYGPRIPTIGQPFSSGDSDWDWMNREKTRQAQLFANRRKDNFNGPMGIFPMDQSDARSRSLNPYVPQGSGSGGSLDIKAEVKVNIEAATVDDFNDKFQKQFKAELENTLQQYTR
ncbi:MAG: tail tape measure [Myoviridae sp. ctThM1]|nr:MAG: tail tape measure [Myoviridae sp. ctThM1]